MRPDRLHLVSPALIGATLLTVSFTVQAVERSLWVTASAFNSVEEQTDENPSIGAWGDKLRPGMKVIAVSPDLIEDYGLTRGTKVRIDGLPHEYVVLDRMPDDWEQKIDIYMGVDIDRAIRWGLRKVRIRWQAE